MSVDWRRLSRQGGLTTDGDGLAVVFADERRQKVYVDASRSDVLRLWSIVARPGLVRTLAEPTLSAWQRNRLTELVGFSVDSKERLIGECWVPTAGLTDTEWCEYVNALAKTADRFEYLLTGADAE